MLTAIALGFALGLRHAADADHVAAIGALVARHRRPGAAAWIGAAWGLGHGLTVLCVGGALVAWQVAVAPAWALGAELAVALVLIALGLANLRSWHREGPAHRHPAPARALRPAALRSLGVGLVHGLAGSAALALLALAAMPDPLAAALYLGVFALGTIAGMVALSLGLGLPMALASSSNRAARWLTGGSGVLSIGVGLYLAVAIGRASNGL